jgi:DNA-binding CsgD family transcriptional regulator
LEAVARKADGVVLLADDGTPTFMNDKASAILNAADGLAFARGRFVTARLPETARLLALIMAACDAVPRADGAGGGRMLVHRPSHKHPYLLHVSPAPRTERFLTARRIAAVLQISDLAAEREASKHALRETFGLSARESDLAVELVRLGDLEAAAKRVGMALNTARNHLHSVFLKTGVHTQADLVHLLSRVL